MSALGDVLPFAVLLVVAGLLGGPCDRWLTRWAARLGKPVQR